MLSMVMLEAREGSQNMGCNCLLCLLNLRMRSELTWFMKGLRPEIRLLCLRMKNYLVRIDLIYEGIATPLRIQRYGLGYKWSELTWFMKGLRPSAPGCPCASAPRRVRIDLIYEGIATSAIAELNMPFSTCVRIDLIYEGIATLISIIAQ